MSHGRFMPEMDVFLLRGNHFDAYPIIRETNNGDCPGFMNNSLSTLCIGKALRDSNMPIAFSVNPIHFTAEEKAVRGSVMQLIDSDIIMNHLMKDGIFDKGFGQVDTGVDPEREILIAVGTEEPLFAAGEGEFAEETFGVGKFDRDRRELPVEETGIEVVKAGLYVRNRWFQFMISNL